MEKQTYQAPEVYELGKAAELTLGFVGCTPDGNDCEKYVIDEQVDEY
jgi:hypothetical protein